MRKENEYFAHESSYVDVGSGIGVGTKIWHYSHLQSGANIGKNCSIGQNVNIGNGVKIQNNVGVNILVGTNKKRIVNELNKNTVMNLDYSFYGNSYTARNIIQNIKE